MPMTVRDGNDGDAESQDFDSNGIIVRDSKDILDALSSLEGMRF